jgi:hypothetical protein
MKRTGNLYNSIVSLENLYVASKKAQKGKTKHNDIINWNKDLDRNILELHKSLVEKSYAVPEYSIFIINEPKERTISKLPFKERVVHHAILNYLEPILKSCFISQTYSCIKGRGIHKCLKDLNRALLDKENTIYCLKLDIKKFYPSIDNEILKAFLKRKFKDSDLLWLLGVIIDSCRGIPLGNYTSQWFGNLYLNSFDHWIKEEKRIKHYFRYCDDLVILGKNKEFLHILRKSIQLCIGKNLKLELSKYQIFPVISRGINFVGYVSYHSHIMLRKSIKKRLKRMIMKNPNRASIVSYKGWTLHANCRHLERKLLIT